MQELEYQQVVAISQSAIKKFRKVSLLEWKETFIDKVNKDDDDDTTESMTFGSLVDTIAFSPALFNDRFFLPQYPADIPGDKLKIVVDKVYKYAKELVDNKVLLNKQGELPEPLYIPDIYELGEFRDIIIKAAKEVKYGGGKWSNNTIMDHVYSAQDYYRALVEAKKRSVISTIESADAHDMVKSLQQSSSTAPYFVQHEGEILLFQQEIFDDYDYEDIKVPIKMCADIIRIVPTDQLIYLPDLKTIYNVKEFKDHAVRYGYLEQLSFYRFMVRKWLQRYKGGIYKDFQIVTPFDIVIDPITKMPCLYEFDERDLEIIEFGCKEKGIKGWRHTLDEIAWHIKNNVWNQPKELYENGKIKLKFFYD